ncbi:MAG: 4-hydroxybutyryl-CoA dehydratase [Candidatus Schekmanbacteria bacterium]|nr:4-hydroxybutyryl-CoA dehydratase [Candidatus Schekmanbacteria bacterium]
MKSPEEYLESLRRLKRTAFILGERIDSPHEHPLVAPSTLAMAETYAMAREADHAELFTARSHLSGEPINRFTHIMQDRQDLVYKVEMLRALGRRTATCFQRCAGLDALNTMFSVTYELARSRGTAYHKRFLAFLAGVQERDEVVAACMTDAKGDRRRRPSEQADPDVYLRVVERRADGVLVSGAKLHITGALNSHHLLVLPTRRLRSSEQDWAISFAIPADTKGVTFILGRQPADTRRLERGGGDTGNRYGGHEAAVLFDRVFVAHEQIFMNGETAFMDPIIRYFGALHRTSYGGCKPGMGDALIGASSRLARANGTREVAHIREKLAEMVQANEVLYACGLAASHKGFQTPAGCACADVLLANVCKLNVTRNPYQIARLATDIAGGLLATLPAAADFANEQTGPALRRFLAAAEGIETEERRRLLRFVESTVAGTGGVCYLMESVHGAGSPQAQIMQIQDDETFAKLEGAAQRLLEDR